MSRARVVSMCLLLSLAIGCTSKESGKDKVTTSTVASITTCSEEKPAVPERVTEYFKKTQADTVTPYGKIMIESVGEAQGRLYYETEDGTLWLVTYVKRDDGVPFTYDMPEKIFWRLPHKQPATGPMPK